MPHHKVTAGKLLLWRHQLFQFKGVHCALPWKLAIRSLLFTCRLAVCCVLMSSISSFAPIISCAQSIWFNSKHRIPCKLLCECGECVYIIRLNFWFCIFTLVFAKVEWTLKGFKGKKIAKFVIIKYYIHGNNL